MSNPFKSTATIIQCGFCQRYNEAMSEPTMLPCAHVHCKGCIASAVRTDNKIRCPLTGCGAEIRMPTIANLQASKKPVGAVDCDACTLKGDDDYPAIEFCNSCDKKYCKTHREWHQSFFPSHSCIDIEKHLAEVERSMKVKCSAHNEEPAGLGCKRCLMLICMKCVPNLSGCPDGTSHKLVAIEELIVLMNKQIENVKEKVEEKDNKCEALVKLTTSTIVAYEKETDNLVKRIHVTRDDQMDALTSAYKQLEEDLLKKRKTAVIQMRDYVNGALATQSSNLKSELETLGESYKKTAKCDIVPAFRRTRNAMVKLTQQVIPGLAIDSVIGLQAKGKCRSVELAIAVTEGGVAIDSEEGIKAVERVMPRYLTHLKTVHLSKFPLSVSRCKGITYVSLLNSSEVLKIESDYNFCPTNLKFPSNVEAITHHKQLSYTLLTGPPRQVFVHDLSQKFITKWQHIDTDNQYTGVVVTGQHVVVPDRVNKMLAIHPLSGGPTRGITCPISSDYISLAAMGQNRVVVSDFGSSRVFCINVTTGQTLWTSRSVRLPEGVTCYGDEYVLVAGQGNTKIKVLDAGTGEVKSEISHDAISGGSGYHVFDMTVDGDTLVVANYSTCSLLFYKLNK
ncbi:uncharacterized protein [Watersipora subatra]|uniref:uncharacterized protein n=1 Tax=Watersipora subatra TaxID=2589382 RepID=UPI00355B5BE9